MKFIRYLLLTFLTTSSLCYAVRDGNGNYNLPAGNPVQSGTTISSSWANNTLSDVANALTGSVSRDGQSPLTGNLNAGGYVIRNLANGTLRNHSVNVGQIQDSSLTFLTNVAGTNTITANLSNLTAYVVGQKFTLKPANSNTGATTLNINNIGAKSIINNGLALNANDLKSSQFYEVTYDGTNFQLNTSTSSNQFVNLQDFGAIPNDGIDDCTAVQNAVNSVVSTRRTLYAPAGEYKLDCNITIGGRITMIGDGMNNTIFNYTPVNGVAFTWTADGSYSSLKGLKFYNNNNPRIIGQTSTAFQTYQGGAAVFYLFDEVWIDGFSMWGIDWNDSFNGKYVNGRIRNNGVRASLAGLGNDGQGGGVQYQRIIFTGAATTGNDFTNTYITGNNVGVQMKKGGSNQKAFNTRFDNVICETNYICIDLRNTGTGNPSSYNFLNTVYGEANLFAMAMLDEGTTISSYQNNTIAGTGTPPSTSVDGADGINFFGRFVEDKPSRFRVGNNSLTQNIAFAIDKGATTNYISKARFFNNNSLTLVPDSTSSTDTYVTINSGNGSPEGSVSATPGSPYFRNNPPSKNQAIYTKLTGTGNTGWSALSWNEITKGDTANRPSSPTAGTVYANTEYGNTEQYDGARWRNTATGVANPVNMGNGGTTNIQPKVLLTYNTNEGTVSSQNITLPSCVSSGDRHILGTAGQITVVNLTSTSIVSGNTTTMPANSSIEYVCNDNTGKWYKIR